MEHTHKYQFNKYWLNIYIKISVKCKLNRSGQILLFGTVGQKYITS